MKPGQVPTFEVIPAVDILDGKCVRLKQGKYDDVTVYYPNPLDAAKRWISEGAKRLHLVDLDGARTGILKNATIVQEIIQTSALSLSKGASTVLSAPSPVKVQIGGGIRSIETAKQILSWGADRVILGTSAINKPELLQQLCVTFPGKIAVSLDAHGNQVATEGWLKESGQSLEDIIPVLCALGVPRFIYTDIHRDGMLSGPNIDGLKYVTSLSPVPIIASGGVSTNADIHQLQSLFESGVEGCIVGRAIYEKTVTLNTL